MKEDNNNLEKVEHRHYCEYCGKETNYFGSDPYDSEINGDYTEHWICNDCYNNASMEI